MTNIKTYVSNRLGIRFIKFDDKILTSDGVLLEHEKINSLTKEEYDDLKKNESKYDYEISKINNVLTLKSIPLENKIDKQIKKVKNIPKKKKIKISFNFFARYSLLFVSVICACLSIYYTTLYFMTYVMGTIIPLMLSSSMFVYSLMGFQFVEELKKRKKYIMSIVLVVTSTMVLLFSMYSSADVNFTRLQKTIDIYTTENKTSLIAESKKNNIDEMILILKEEKISIEKEKIDISNQIQYNIENDKGSRNVDLNYQLNRRNNRIKEINDKTAELVEEKSKLIEENNLISEIDNKPKTFYNLLGNLFHIKGEVLQMIVMMIASVFIDAISPIALWIYKKKL